MDHLSVESAAIARFDMRDHLPRANQNDTRGGRLVLHDVPVGRIYSEKKPNCTSLVESGIDPVLIIPVLIFVSFNGSYPSVLRESRSAIDLW